MPFATKNQLQHWVLYPAIALLGAVVYSSGISNALLADDWPVIARNLGLRLADIPHLLMSTHAGWYRPLFDLLLAGCYQLLGLQALGYHIVALGLYASTTLLAGVAAEALTGERRCGLLAALLFSLLGVHAEPVLWVAASNELLAGLFVLLSLIGYIRFRTASRPGGYYALAAIGYLLALMAKETAVFLPLALLWYDICRLYRSALRLTLRKLLPVLPFLLLMAAYTVFRALTGSPYPADVPPARIAVNLLYYAATLGLALPDNYGYLSTLPLWRQAPWLPLLTVSASLVGLGLLGWLLRRTRAQADGAFRRVLAFSGGWCGVALLPVILTATGRTAFLASIGVAWLGALVVVAGWRRSRGVSRVYIRLVTGALVLLLAANLTVTLYRCYWWRQAGRTMTSVLLDLQRRQSSLPPGQAVCLLGLPDYLHYAYTFRNAFPALSELLYPRRALHVTLAEEDRAVGTGIPLGCEAALVLNYLNGKLVSAGSVPD